MKRPDDHSIPRPDDGHAVTQHVVRIGRDVMRAGGVKKPRQARHVRMVSEQAHHKAFAAWLKLVNKQFPELWWTTIDHGQRMSWGQIGKAKARGTKPGVFDIIFCWRGRFGGVEMKTKGGSLSKDQIACHEAVRLAGGLVFTAYSFDEARQFMTDCVFAASNPGHGL